jgi:hypothetical protein
MGSAMFEGFTGKEALLWVGGVLVAATIIIFGAIWIADAFLDAGDPKGLSAEMRRK